MHRQVGDLQLDEHGLARRGLLVRHLILPNNLAGTGDILRYLSEKISTNTYINLMDQYRPAHNAHLYPKINRPIRAIEYLDAVEMAHEVGLNRLDERKPMYG
jgi:putative pyruvate formate lyase activating enzyme